MNDEEEKIEDNIHPEGVERSPAKGWSASGGKDLCESCDEYKSGWKRALADYENLKRDMDDQLAGSRNRIKSGFVYDLLPVMDNFTQAVNHAPDLQELLSHPEGAEGESKDLARFKTWLQGVLYIQKQFEDVLKGLGLERIEVGTEFDPNMHESVGEGEEMKEVNSGWKMGDQVIRPAKVIINKNKNSK